ncbi:MAG TPA: LacI family DNA-binding transcriptional regulator [Propionibacteriaceae bacterium]|nr:LacI family DNA-binding transcriptional regulator [Propionibacteriaceae bacterium]
MARLADIAELAGVSVGLVSRVLNDDPATRATAETRERIVRVASELGYRPHYAARALKFARTNTIALVVPDLTNAFFAELARGVEDGSRRLGYTVLLGRSESLTDETQISRLLDEGRVDGFLLQGRDDQTTQSLTQLIGGAPVVLVNTRIEDRPGSVMIDDQAAARMATEHLLERGHRKIGLITGLPTSLTARLREEGYKAALGAAGIRARAERITRLGYHVDTAAPAVDRLMSKRDAPTALVVANVNAAFGVLTHARHLGYRVPEGLSVIAIHDAWTADHTWPPLTTVRMPLYDLGIRAVAALKDRLSGSEGTDHIVSTVPPQVIERESVASAT